MELTTKSLMYYPSEDKAKWFDRYPKIYTLLLNINKNMRIILVLFITHNVITYYLFIAASNFYTIMYYG